MIALKSPQELILMRKAGQISAQALRKAGSLVRVGASTAAIDRAVRDFILAAGAKPSFLHYEGPPNTRPFPGTCCISINDEIVHGFPSDRIIREGDIVSVDVGAIYKGYHGDNAATFAAGAISEEAERLLAVTKEALFLGIAQAVSGNRIGDIGFAVQSYVEKNGFSVVRLYTGHGVGASLHEDPEVPNFGKAGRGARLFPGMTIAIEPMVNAGTHLVKHMPNGWTAVTADGSLSAHFEHTVAITDGDPVILTQV